MKEEKMMAIKILTKLLKVGKMENSQENDEKLNNQNEKKLELDDARKNVLKTLSEANEVRYFYTLNKENEDHIAYINLGKAISNAILSDRKDINDLKNNEIHLTKSIEQVNIYLSRRYLHTKMQQASDIISKLNTDELPMNQYLVDVEHALKIANDCHANYLSTACETRNAFDQLNHVVQALEDSLHPA